MKRLVFLATGLIAIGSSLGAAYAQSTTTVVTTNFAFAPANARVSAGRSTWTIQNPSGSPHNMHIEGNGVSMDVKPDGPVVAGTDFTGAVTLAAGTYAVWCPVGMHRQNGMEGTLIVAAATGAAQVPGALPRTGEADSSAPLTLAGVALGGLLVAFGILAREERAAAPRRKGR